MVDEANWNNSSKLPSEEGEYLVYVSNNNSSTKTRGIRILYFFAQHWAERCLDDCYRLIDQSLIVTHWMPLPNLPEGE